MHIYTVCSADQMQRRQPQSVVDLHIARRLYMLMTRNATVSMREHKEMLQNTVIATIYCESKEQEVIQSWRCWQMASGNVLNAESWAMKMPKQRNKNLPAFDRLIFFYVCVSWRRVTVAHMSYSISRCIRWLSKYNQGWDRTAFHENAERRIGFYSRDCDKTFIEKAPSRPGSLRNTRNGKRTIRSSGSISLLIP